MEIELKIALCILIPLTIGLYIYAMIRLGEQIKGKNQLMGWTIAKKKESANK